MLHFSFYFTYGFQPFRYVDCFIVLLNSNSSLHDKVRYYRKRGIVREVRSVRERERETERDGSDVTIVALKLAMILRFPLPKTRTWL